MKIAYIAIPIAGDIEGNLNRLKEVIRTINLQEPDVVPFAPYFADVSSLDDSNPIHRERGFKNNMHLLQLCDEVRLYGPTISKGMLREIEFALELGIPVIPKTIGTAEMYPMIVGIDGQQPELPY